MRVRRACFVAVTGGENAASGRGRLAGGDTEGTEGNIRVRRGVVAISPAASALRFRFLRSGICYR